MAQWIVSVINGSITGTWMELSKLVQIRVGTIGAEGLRVGTMSAHNIQQVPALRVLTDDYNKMLDRMKEGSKKIKGGKWTKADYYLDLADFFDSLDPSSGVDVIDIRGVKYGGHFNFKRDAEELRMLSRKVG